MQSFAFIGTPGGGEMIVILILAVLLFGGRLPEIARSLGKGLVEFRKGMQGIDDEEEKPPPRRAPLPPPEQEEIAPEVPKFRLPSEAAPTEGGEQGPASSQQQSQAP